MKRKFWDVRDDFMSHGLYKIPAIRTRLLATFASGAIIGILAGAMAALLVAPRSGADLRKKLTSKVNELTGKVNELKGRVLEAKSEVREHAVRAAESMRGSESESYRNPNVPIG